MLSNGNSFSNGQSMILGAHPEVWWFRIMRPIQPRP
jgi:hypothetical protein